MENIDDALDSGELWPAVLDALPGAVTVVGPDGTILYYNATAARMLDRKPEYIGNDVRFCHSAQSVEKIDEMLLAFREGRGEPFAWEVERDGGRRSVTFAPLVSDGKLVGAVHFVVPRD